VNLYSLETSTGRCPNCDSVALEWGIYVAVQGFARGTEGAKGLQPHNVETQLVLGCGECRQTLTIRPVHDILELLNRATRRTAEQSDIIAGWAAYGERVKAKRREHGRMMAEVLNEQRSENPEVLLPNLIGYVKTLQAEVASLRAQKSAREEG
jgi:hypothetical protein